MIVNYAKDHDVSVIVIGNNKEWKQNSKLSKKVNQTFVQIPFARLIEMITYKAQELGISVKVIEESYTSGTSFLDNELPIKENYNKSRRIHRGLFKSNSGVLINSDVNGSFQIMKKVFPNAYANGIEGVALHPIVVNACNI
jgi:putative transposase